MGSASASAAAFRSLAVLTLPVDVSLPVAVEQKQTDLPENKHAAALKSDGSLLNPGNERQERLSAVPPLTSEALASPCGLRYDSGDEINKKSNKNLAFHHQSGTVETLKMPQR